MIDKHKLDRLEAAVVLARDAAVDAELGNVVKGGFISSLDHLLRNPMNSMLGMLHLLKDSDLDDSQRRYVASALEAAGYLMTTIDEITNFPLDSNGVDLKETPFDLFKAGKNVIQALSAAAAAKNVFLKFEYEADTPTIFIGDSSALQQVLAKIMECALRETDKGSVTLDISSSKVGDGQTLTRVAFSSTSSDLSKTSVFSSFDFADPELDLEERRIKLELSVCRRIVEKMGGSFDLPPSNSNENDRERILLSIPLPEPSESRITELANERVESKQRKSKPFKRTFNGIRVLLAEDDPINQSLAVAFLSKLGASVDTADNGKIAFDKFRANEYDIVLLDCEMPVMNGFEAAAAIRKLEEESAGTHRTPIIAMTAYAGRGDRENCLAAGMDDHVPKPITLDLLASIAETHIFQNP